MDLEAHDPVDTDTVPDRHAETTAVRDRTCVFPWCTRPARRCDTDHTIPAARGGPTCPCNLAPLCRRHHRIKTHGGWTYTAIEPGSTCGPPGTATSTSATPTAPKTSPATTAGHPTNYQAPNPAASGAIGTPDARRRSRKAR